MRILNLLNMVFSKKEKLPPTNAEFDKKLDAALGIADNDKRRALMKDIEQILQDSGILIQPYWRSLFNHSVSKVNGLRMHQTFEHHFEEVWLG